MKRIILMVLVCTAGFHELRVQPFPGDLVRIFPASGENRIVGEVLSISGSSVAVQSGDSTYLFGSGDIRRMDVSIGQKRRTFGGAVVGLLAGTLIGAKIGDSIHKNESNDEFSRDQGCCAFEIIPEGLANGALVGAAVGTITGALIGTAIKKERWRRTSLDVYFGMMPSPSKDFALKPKISIRIPIGR